MTVLLIRHAHAGDRGGWAGNDRHRPLTPMGERQAAALVELLAGYDITRVYSSPFLRCVQTVEPLAAARGLRVEVDETLAEAHGDEGLELLDGSPGVTVLCGHGDNVPDMLDSLGAEWSGACQKGSTWVVEMQPISAHYLPPPD